ncbi:MAG: hypothetical protein JST40_05830 [Armatimonadetes bacterium]|nr:hypothetical protein [Armatimonadota bacterium]
MISALLPTLTMLLQTSPTPSLSDLQKIAASPVSQLKVGGATVGRVMAFGQQAVVLGVSSSGGSTSPTIVAAQYGKGRAAAIGHGAVFSQNLEHALISGLTQWLRSGKPLGFLGGGAPAGHPEFLNVPVSEFDQAVFSCGGFVVHSGVVDALPNGIARLTDFVKSGGGLLVMDTPWGWLQLNPGKSIRRDLSSQKLLAPMGLAFADGYLDDSNGTMSIAPAISENHAGKAFAELKSDAKLDRTQAQALACSLRAMLADGQEKSQFTIDLKKAASELTGTSVPTLAHPVLSTDYRGQLAATFYDQMWRELPPEKVTAHPAAADFPGSVDTNAKRESVTVSIGGGTRYWWSTGRYAAPGEVVSAQVAGSGSEKLVLRIGGHTDELWGNETWPRFPSISSAIGFKAGKAVAANPFGGLIYVCCDQPLDKVNITLSGTVQAPVYFLCRTTDDEWKRKRSAGAPWGEIVGDHCAISVPSSVLKTLDDPKAIAEYFDEVVAQCEQFYGVPVGSTDQRYQADREISAGYMHSGYPIMTHDDVAQRFVDIKVLRGKSGGEMWGFYHEVGHNFQLGEWTWDGWGETTNNLYSLFACAHFNGDLGGHGAMAPNEVEARLAAVKANPGAKSYYNLDPWYGLTFWTMIQKEFGFKPITTFFTKMAAKPASDRPRNEQQRKDAFLKDMSQLIQRDLGPYCRMWGVGCSRSAEAAVSEYQEWMPAGLR